MAATLPAVPGKMASSQGPVLNLTAQAASGGSAWTAIPGLSPNPHCAELPVVDLALFLNAADTASPEVQRLCEAVAACLRDSSALVVRDPRVDPGDNGRFLSLMESYFAQSTAERMADVRPELDYQVGATPENVERPRCLRDPAILAHAASLAPEDRPTLPTDADPKWRFFWRVGERPVGSEYPELNAAPVVPSGLPEWRDVMDGWGGKMLAAVEAVAEMAARGLGLPADAFTSRMRQGPHLLAPTGTDVAQYGTPGTVFAGFHYDLNFLTIHGRSRYPGLNAWLRGGRRIPVRIPEGCLLLQAGKQMEWLTGGHVAAGFHEVVCTKETVAAAELAAAEGRPQWRVSSTVFSQIASDQTLQPLGRFATPGALAAYPPTPAGQQVQQELKAINLRAGGE